MRHAAAFRVLKDAKSQIKLRFHFEVRSPSAVGVYQSQNMVDLMEMFPYNLNTACFQQSIEDFKCSSLKVKHERGHSAKTSMVSLFSLNHVNILFRQ